MAPNDLLRDWIAKAQISNAEAARQLGYDRSNFHRIVSGSAKPTMELAYAIDKLTDGEVPMAVWVGFEPHGTPTQRDAA
jgi:hypothetical protein